MTMANTKRKRVSGKRPRIPATVIVKRRFVGDITLTEAFIPVISEDLRNRIKQIRTFDKGHDSS